MTRAALRTALSLLFLFGTLQPSTAQNIDFQNYEPLKAEGDIPDDFLVRSSDKYETDLGKIDEDLKKKEQKTEDQFYLESNFEIDRLLQSGLILFNDPVTDYINNVADEILKDEPELRDELRFYAVRSPVANAFATGNGLILINLGLIARLDNEAQLAFILCHEIVHYEEGHSLDLYKASVVIEEGDGIYKNSSKTDKLVARNNYSQELETFADSEGLERYLKTDYDIESLQGVFKMLQFANYPWANGKFEYSFFENPQLKFPEDLLIEEIAPIVPDEDDEEQSTHPAPKERMKVLEEALTGKSNEGRKAFIQAESIFNNIRDICRYEMTELYMSRSQYYYAMYNAYLMLRNDPNNNYLQKSMLRCLWAYVIYTEENDEYAIVMDHDDVQGEQQAMAFWVEELCDRPEGLAVTALAYALGLPESVKTDEDIQYITEQLIKNLALNYDFDPFDEDNYEVLDANGLLIVEEEIEAEPEPEEAEEEVESEEDDGDESWSWDTDYDPDDDEGWSFGIDKDRSWYQAGLYGFKDDKDFQEAFNSYRDKKDEYELDDSDNWRIKFDVGVHKKDKSDQQTSPIDKVVLVDPLYLYVNLQKKDQPMQYLDSESGQLDLLNRMSKNAELAGMDHEIVSPYLLGVDNVDAYNDLLILNDWVNQQFDNPDNVRLSTIDREEINGLVEKYGSKYYMWSGVISAKERVNATPLLYAVLMPPILPFVIPSVINSKNNLYYFFIVFDIETGEVASADYFAVNSKSSKAVLNSHLYHSFNVIKTGGQ